MVAWSPEEESVLLYYASRDIKHRIIVQLLKHKCNTSVRTVSSIENRIRRIREACKDAGLGQMQDTTIQRDPIWDRKVVDSWLVSKMERGKLLGLIEFDGSTAAILEPVSTLDHVGALCMLINLRQDHVVEDFVKKMALTI